MQSMFSSEDWNRVEIISITPYPEGFQLSESIYLDGMIKDTSYQAYLLTIRKLHLPRIYDSEDTLAIFASILQRIISTGAIVGVNTTMEIEEYIEEDEEGKEVVIHEAGLTEVYFRIWKKIEVDNKMGVFLIADEGSVIEDVDEAWFEIDYSLSETEIKTFCDLITELADAGHLVQSEVNDKDVRVLELVYHNEKVQSHYFLLDDYETEEKQEIEVFGNTIDNLFNVTFYVRYNEMEALSRLYSSSLDENDEDDR